LAARTIRSANDVAMADLLRWPVSYDRIRPWTSR
jgi:hypothetical protein